MIEAPVTTFFTSHTVEEKTMVGESEQTGTSEAEPRTTSDPIIIDLGARSKREVDRLRKGRGDLMDEIDDCLQELTTVGRIAESAQQVIIVVAEKPRRLRPMIIPPGIPIPVADDEDEDEDDEDED
jgi:hypothetical protein